jgi:hypothetical protein
MGSDTMFFATILALFLVMAGNPGMALAVFIIGAMAS